MLVRNKANILCYTAVLLFALFVLWLTMNLESFESRIMPLCICVALLLLVVCAIVQEIRTAGCGELEEDSEKQQAKVPLAACLGWVFGLAAGVWLLGFYCATPVFIIAYIKANSGTWKQAILTGALATAAMYIIFPVLLQVDMYSGYIASEFL